MLLILEVDVLPLLFLLELLNILLLLKLFFLWLGLLHIVLFLRNLILSILRLLAIKVSVVSILLLLLILLFTELLLGPIVRSLPLGFGSSSRLSCSFRSRILHVFVQTIRKNICLATSCFNLISLLVCVDVAAAILWWSESSGTAMSLHLWSCWFLPEWLRVKEALPSLNLLPLLFKLFFL